MTEIPCQTCGGRGGESETVRSKKMNPYTLSFMVTVMTFLPVPPSPTPFPSFPCTGNCRMIKKAPIKTSDLLTARDARLNLQPFSRRRIDSLSEQRGETRGDYSNLHANTCSTRVQMYKCSVHWLREQRWLSEYDTAQASLMPSVK